MSAIRFSHSLINSKDESELSEITEVVWSPNAQFIAAPNHGGSIVIWNAFKKEIHGVIYNDLSKNYIKYFTGDNIVSWSPDGSMIANALDNRMISIYDSATLEKKRELRSPQFIDLQFTDDLFWSIDGSKLYVIDGNRTAITIWNSNNWDSHSIDCQNFEQTLGGHLKGALSPDGKVLALGTSDNKLHFLDTEKHGLIKTVNGFFGHVYNLTWSTDGGQIALSCHNNNVCIWDVHDEQMHILEGHKTIVSSVSFLNDQSILCSNSCDGEVIFWRTDLKRKVHSFKEKNGSIEIDKFGKVSFHPSLPFIATLGGRENVVNISEVNYNFLLQKQLDDDFVSYTSAKIVLVGESGVGKSCLTMKICEDKYPNDFEHRTTHGMEVRTIDAENLHPIALPLASQRRDIIFWDLGGQEEYRLVHQMFLHDTTIALFLFDPTRGNRAFEDIRDWDQRIRKSFKGKKVLKILVGSKQDKPNETINQKFISLLLKQCEFEDYIEVSAMTGRNIDELKKLISTKIDWDKLTKTSRPKLFQIIRDSIQIQKEKGEVVVLLDDLNNFIRKNNSDIYNEYAVSAVVEHLAAQGHIAKTRLIGSEDAIILDISILEKYAGSLIIAARDNPHNIPVIEERILGSSELPLPGINQEDRIGRIKEKIVIECIIELMILHGICFRESGLIFFPTLFPQTEENDSVKIEHSVSIFYDFTGAIDNIYAALVAKLIISKEFGDGRMWSNRIEFDRNSNGICGIRQIVRKGGVSHLDLYFDEKINIENRRLFTGFVEEHLRNHGIEISEHCAIKCRECEEEITEKIVQANLLRGERDVICPLCRTTTLISEGVSHIRKVDPLSDQKIIALKKEVEKKIREDVINVKNSFTNHKSNTSLEKVRVLHLSDLHFTQKTSPQRQARLLIQDLKKGGQLGFEKVEYIVVSGDFTHQGNVEGFKKSKEFINILIQELGLSPLRCIFVPGNHDIQDLKSSYDWSPDKQGAPSNSIVEKGDVFLIRNESEYKLRLKRFSDEFFHKIMISKNYPLESDRQGIAYLFTDTKIQFLTLNTSFEIDQFHRKRSGINSNALINLIETADREIDQAIERGDLQSHSDVLRIGVWHHSILGPDSMNNHDFLEVLQKAGVRLCLHGDVHEMRRNWIGYWHEKNIHIIGAGSFGSGSHGRPESTPCMYNLIEMDSSLIDIRVHTREKRKENSAWQGWFEWPNPDSYNSRLPFYDFKL